MNLVHIVVCICYPAFLILKRNEKTEGISCGEYNTVFLNMNASSNDDSDKSYF